MENREKRDLPEVVAEILIEQHAVREEIAALRQEMHEQLGGLRQEMHEQLGGLRQEMHEQIGGLRQEMHDDHTAFMAQQERLFNRQTDAILDAINRGVERDNKTDERVDQVEARITKLENPAA